MIEKPLLPAFPPQDPDDPYGLLENADGAGLGGVDVEVPDEEPGSEVIEHEDGSATVVLGEEEPAKDFSSVPHDGNLIDVLDEDELSNLSSELVELYRADNLGRKDWIDAYTEGLDYLGVKVEERSKPWPGAAGVYHPLLMEAVVRFQSQAMSEIFPPAGPAKTRILGYPSADKNKLAQRVQDELNYQLVCKMPDYRGETERLLFRLALVGSCFRKIYYDSIRKRVCAKFVPAEDFVVPYGETDLSTAERFTHVNRLSGNELKRLQVGGFYSDKVELGEPEDQTEEIADKEGDVTGVRPATPGSERYTVLEMHVDWDIGEDPDGLALPYVISIEEASGKVLAIRRNWKEGDEGRNRQSWFVSYEYVPGLGFYGFGLVHLIGGITKSVTSILRQLIDAGTLSNLPGGLKARGLRIKGDDSPIRPGEFRDVDVGSGKIAEAITFLPYKEPSAVLHNLLQQLVEEGRRVGSIAEVDVGDMKGEAPVGTTLALLERAQKVMSAVQARLHYSLGKELKLIAGIIAEDMEPQYDFDIGEPDQNYNRQEDFKKSSVEIVPVSDPSATTMSQRVVQHQAALQMAAQAPQVYDIPKLHRAGLEILGIKEAEEIVKLPDEMKPKDPVTENMAILKGEPVKAFLFQDHQSHIAVHMAALQDPKIQMMVGQSPNAQAVMGAAQAHVAEHIAFAYRQQIEQQMGQPLPTPDQDIPPEVEAQIARAAVPAAQALLGQHQKEMAEQEVQETMQDPLVQLQAKELAIKEADQQRKAETDFAKMLIDAEKSELKAQIELARIEAQREIAAARMGVDIAGAAQDRDLKAAESAERLRIQADATRAASERTRTETKDTSNDV